MASEKLKGHLAMLLTAVIFGLNIPVTKSLMPDWIGSLGVTYLRMVVACAAFWSLSFFLPRERVRRKDMWLLVVGSLFGIVLNQTAFIVGLEHTTSIDASIVITITPVLVMLLSAFFLKEPVSWMKAGGVLLGATGALLVILSSGDAYSIGKGNMLGNLICLGSSLSYAIYLIITRSIVQRYTPVTLMKWMFLYAVLFSLPLGANEVLQARAFTPAADPSVYFRIFYFTLLATFLTYLLIPVALKRIRPTTVSMYNYVQPLVASATVILLGQEQLVWQKPVAGLLIFTGVYLVTMSKSRADVERESNPSEK